MTHPSERDVRSTSVRTGEPGHRAARCRRSPPDQGSDPKRHTHERSAPRSAADGSSTRPGAAAASATHPNGRQPGATGLASALYENRQHRVGQQSSPQCAGTIQWDVHGKGDGHTATTVLPVAHSGQRAPPPSALGSGTDVTPTLRRGAASPDARLPAWCGVVRRPPPNEAGVLLSPEPVRFRPAPHCPTYPNA